MITGFALEWLQPNTVNLVIGVVGVLATQLVNLIVRLRATSSKAKAKSKGAPPAARRSEPAEDARSRRQLAESLRRAEAAETAAAELREQLRARDRQLTRLAAEVIRARGGADRPTVTRRGPASKEASGSRRPRTRRPR